MKIYPLLFISLSVVCSEPLPDTGLKKLISKRRNSTPETSTINQLAIVDPKRELECESARYMANPTARSLFDRCMHIIRTEKGSVFAEDIIMYERAFNYLPHRDDPQIADEQERKKLCVLNKCLRLFMGVAHTELEHRTREGIERVREQQRESQFFQQRMIEKLEHNERMTSLHKEKCVEKDVVVAQMLEINKVHSSMVNMSLAVAGAAAVTGIVATYYSLIHRR